MKKLVLIISVILPLLFSFIPVNIASATNDIEVNEECSSFEDSTVRIVNNYNVFVANGFVYKVENNYNYIVTSSKILNNVNSFRVIYNDNSYSNITLIGYDSSNEVAVFKGQKNGAKGVCIGNSNYLYKGQKHYLYGYFNNKDNFVREAYLSSIGEAYYISKYVNVYRSFLQIDGNNRLNGVGVFDKLGKLVGMITGYDDELIGSSYMIDSNKLVKIVDSIVKTGNYNINYIKYNLVDYSRLSSRLKDSYGVSYVAKSGAVVVTFKPLKFVFGGLNQGMVIVAVNGVEINSTYELDKQLSRYEKKSKVCLKVIKKNGKEAFYYVKV